MKKNNLFVLALALSAPLLFTNAFAEMKKEGKNAEVKIEHEMMAACQKEYARELKGKNFNETVQWIGTEEKSSYSEAFKKSKCATLHEEWKKASAKKEMVK